MFILVTEIFIAHGSHCRDCEDVVLSVATYFNMTGYCKCFLDLCSLPEEWSRGMTQYYENQIAKRQKVIILFTINESEECKENIKGKKIRFLAAGKNQRKPSSIKLFDQLFWYYRKLKWFFIVR